MTKEHKNQEMKHSVTRRDFARIAGAFGLTSTMLAWFGLTKSNRLFSSEALASEASGIQKKRYKKDARFSLKFGASGFNPDNLKIERQGALIFVSDLEERTDGEIRVEFLGGNSVCGQLTCIKKCQTGEVDIYASSTQNASATARYMNVLDFAYLWPGRAAQYHFFYHPKSEPLFREPLRKFHKLQFLWTHCELRDIMMGLKYKDQPRIMKVEDLKDTKLRVTGTQLGKIAMQLLGTNPVPVAWEETLNGLRTGLIDGAETWSSAVGYAGMSPVVSQDVRLQFFSGNEHAAMNLGVFEKLGPQLQDAVMESAFLTQVHVQAANEAALVTIVGITDPPLPGTLFDQHGVVNCYLPPEELQKAEHMTSPKHNPEPWQQWRDMLNVWAGNVDIFEELYKLAREIPADTRPLDVPPRRWWKA